MKIAARVLLALLVAAALIGAPGAAPAHAQGDTTAVAINTKDGAELFKFAFQVRRTMQDVVEQGNAAVAYASCTDCETVAISFQVLLAGGDPSTVSPTNLAIALNQDCSSCTTIAYAYQFLLGTDGPTHFTAEGNRRIAELRKRLRDLQDQDLTVEQLGAAVGDVASELRDVLATQLVPAGPPDADGDARSPAPDSGDPAATPTATPAPDLTASPTPTATSSPEPTVTASPTATATPTPETP
jgi:putative peptide zinc metalloprotease protein